MSNREDIQEYLRRIEMCMPPAWTLKFGEWDKFKEIVEDLMDLQKSEESASGEVYELKSEMEELKDEVRDLVSDLENMYLLDEDKKELDDIIEKFNNLVCHQQKQRRRSR